MRKLWVVYNPRSSHHAAIEAEVLATVRKGVPGFLVGKYEAKKASVRQNAEMLAAMLGDGDLVVSAGGDGTATMAANAVMMSGKDVAFSALGYGNFNDMAEMLGTRRPVEYGGEYVGGITEIIGGKSRVREIYPLEILVDGEHWRYAMCYATMGLLAEASEMMDDGQVRESLNTGKRGVMYSLMMAVRWYLKNRKRKFLPAGLSDSAASDGSAVVSSGEAESSGTSEDGGVEVSEDGEVVVKLNGVSLAEGMTDYLAVNGPTMSGLMKGGKWYLGSREFGRAVRQLGKFWKMVRFGLRSVIFGLKLTETKGDVLEFSRPSNVEIQAEGEYERLTGVSRIEVRKAERGIKVVMGK